MNIQQLQYVLAVADYKLFELAADKCFVTQSTLSTMISRFEEEMGIKIFDRKKKPVTITKEGELVIEHIKTIIHHINHFKTAVKEMKNEVSGNIKIAIIPTVSPFLLPLFIKDFANKYPALQIEVFEYTTQNIIQQIKNRTIDIGIVSTPLFDDELEETKLYNEPFLFFDTHKKKKTGAPTKKDLENVWLLEEGHCMRNQALQLCNMNNPSKSFPNIKFKAGSIDSLVRMVKASKGSTLIPYLASLDFSETDQQFLQSFSAPIPVRTIGIISHQHFAKKKIIGLLKQEITEKVEPYLPNNASKTKALKPM